MLSLLKIYINLFDLLKTFWRIFFWWKEEVWLIILKIVPQNADQSLQTNPAPITSLPLLIVAAHKGIYNKLANSSNSSTLVKGCTNPP